MLTHVGESLLPDQRTTLLSWQHGQDPCTGATCHQVEKQKTPDEGKVPSFSSRSAASPMPSVDRPGIQPPGEGETSSGEPSPVSHSRAEQGGLAAGKQDIIKWHKNLHKKPSQFIFPFPNLAETASVGEGLVGREKLCRFKHSPGSWNLGPSES